MQRKIVSLIEVCLSIAIGFAVALCTQLLVFPLFGIYVDIGAHVSITILFTTVSVVRSYFVRRLFNWLHVTGRYR